MLGRALRAAPRGAGQRVARPYAGHGGGGSVQAALMIETASPAEASNGSITSGGASSITSSVLASRTSGTAPLYVHFDATGTTSSVSAITLAANGGAFRNILHAFDFGDSGAGTWTQTGNSRNTHSGGPITAHVFETPGTYTVNVTHTHSGTGAKTATPITITVADPDVTYAGTLTICVSNSGASTPAGPAGCDYATSASITSLTSGRRYLFRRGQAHDCPSGSWNNVQCGAYGTGAKPIVSVNGIQNLGTTGGNVMMDLQVGGRIQYARGAHNLAMRVDVTWSGGATSSLAETQEDGFTLSKYTCFWEVTTDNPTYSAGCGMYIGYAAWFALMGCKTYRHEQHAVRITNSYKTCVQNNWLDAEAGCNATKHFLKTHGQYSGNTPNLWDEVSATANCATEKLVVSNNIFGSATHPYAWAAAHDPQNNSGTQIEGIQDVVNENNIYWRGTNGSPTDIVRGGRRITSRGNTCANGSFLLSPAGNSPPGVNSANIPSGWDGPYFSS